jgi:hypothetical protein
MRRIGHKGFVAFLIASLCWSLLWAPVAQAQGAIAAGRLSVAISEITIAKAARWGFAANDPRVTATRAGISGGLTVLAAGVGVVSWPVLLVAAGVAGLVAGAVALSSDGKYKWSFGSDGKITSSGTTAGGYAVGSIGPNVTPSAGGPIGPNSGAVYTQSIGVYDPSKGVLVYHEIAGSAMEIVAATWLGARYDNATVIGCSNGSTAGGQPVGECSYKYVTINGSSGNGTVTMSRLQGYPVSSSTGFYDGRPPAQDTPVVPVVFVKPDEAVTAIPAQVAKQLLSPELMAASVNAAWKAATPASETGGLPWSASDPVTPAEVSDYYAKYPGTIPSVANWASVGTASVSGQVTVPIGSTYSLGGGSSGTLPSSGGGGTVTQPGGGTAPVTDPSPTAPTTPSDPNAVKLDLGPIPNIGAPVLEDTPDAAKILDPGFSLMPDLKNFAVPAHAGVCPTAKFALYNKSYVMDAHCGLLEQNRSVIGAMMILIFTLVATYTVLRA